MKGLLRAVFASLLLCCALINSVAFAKEPYVPFHGLRIIEHRVPTPDGAELSIIEVAGNEGSPTVVLHPGLVETAYTLDDMAQYYHRMGYKVVIAQVRGAGCGEYASTIAPGWNGLKEVLAIDTVAQWRHIRERISGGKPFYAIGHSQGGGQILTMIATARFAPEFAEYVSGVSLWMPAYEVRDLPKWIRRAAPKIKALLRLLLSMGIRQIDFPQRLFGWSHVNKTEGGPVQEAVSRMMERTVTGTVFRAIDGILINRDFTSPRETRRLVRQEISKLLVELLMDWADVVEHGMPFTFDASLIRVPTQVVVAEKDILIRRWLLTRLFTALVNAPQRQQVFVAEAHHVDSAISKKIASVLMPLSERFFREAAALIAERGMFIEIDQQHMPTSLEECRRWLMPEPAPQG